MRRYSRTRKLDNKLHQLEKQTKLKILYLNRSHCFLRKKNSRVGFSAGLKKGTRRIEEKI